MNCSHCWAGEATESCRTLFGRGSFPWRTSKKLSWSCDALYGRRSHDSGLSISVGKSLVAVHFVRVRCGGDDLVSAEASRHRSTWYLASRVDQVPDAFFTA